MADDYGIGRPTVRQATETLIRRGILAPRRGAGTFVRERSAHVDLFSLGGTLRSFSEQGIALETRIVEGPDRVDLDRDAGDLDPPPHRFQARSAFRVLRLGAVDARPVLLEELWFDAAVFPGLDTLELAGSLALGGGRQPLPPRAQWRRATLPRFRRWASGKRGCWARRPGVPCFASSGGWISPRQAARSSREWTAGPTSSTSPRGSEAPMDDRGYFGRFGGAYIPEILVATFDELADAFASAQADPAFWDAYVTLMGSYSCRPTPITFAENLTRHFGGARIYIKREDLNHTGAHKANNVMGQGLLVKRMGKRRVIAETGAGQHGVATATMAARMGFECTIYMGAVDVERQRPNVFWMERLGATVVPVTEGQPDAQGRHQRGVPRTGSPTWIRTHYALGTACGPHPFPSMVTWFQSIIGQEARRQILDVAGALPNRVYACVGGGSNAMGIFSGFLEDQGVELVGVEAGGHGLETGEHATRLASTDASVGVAQGYKTYFLQDPDGQMRETHSVAAGLDYVGVSPILSHLHEDGRVRIEAATDKEVVDALALTVRKEGLIPALESSHAFAQAFREAPELCADDVVLINQSGRGDKDIFTVADAFDDPGWKAFIREKAREYDA